VVVALAAVRFSGAALPFAIGDPGAFVRWGTPVTSALRNLLAAGVVGCLVLAVGVLPRKVAAGKVAARKVASGAVPGRAASVASAGVPDDGAPARTRVARGSSVEV